MRKLASIRRISDIKTHTNADSLELAIVDGWQVVIRKGEFQRGQLIVFCEIDSWIPNEIAPFLSKEKDPKTFEGIKGERLRTIKLRKELSQGLILPINSDLYDLSPAYDDSPENYAELHEGTDVTDLLGIVKWEAPIPANLAGQVAGNFPSFLRKTDQERLQNIYHKILPQVYWMEFEETLKLDGTSCTIFIKDGELGVCSRNLQLKINEENSTNVYVRIALEHEQDLREMCRYWYNHELAIQGEIMGIGIQGNREEFKDLQFFLFDIWDITNQCYLNTSTRRHLATRFNIQHVPVLNIGTSFLDFHTLEEFKNASKIKSINHPVAEGKVYKCVDNPEISFKVINDDFLLSEK